MPDYIAFEDFIARSGSEKFAEHQSTLKAGLERQSNRGIGAKKAASHSGRSAVAALHDKVDLKKEFQAMQNFLLEFYKGVECQYSFLDTAGNHIDCIPIELQSTYRTAKAAQLKLRSKPCKPTNKKKRAKASSNTFRPDSMDLVPHLRRGMKDTLGHAAECPEGCVPIRRITLPRLAEPDPASS